MRKEPLNLRHREQVDNLNIIRPGHVFEKGEKMPKCVVIVLPFEKLTEVGVQQILEYDVLSRFLALPSRAVNEALVRPPQFRDSSKQGPMQVFVG